MMPTVFLVAGVLTETAAELPLIFPVRPRTCSNMEKFGIDVGPNVTRVGSPARMPVVNISEDAVLVLSDNGGFQDETTARACWDREVVERLVEILAKVVA